MASACKPTNFYIYAIFRVTAIGINIHITDDKTIFLRRKLYPFSGKSPILISDQRIRITQPCSAVTFMYGSGNNFNTRNRFLCISIDNFTFHPIFGRRHTIFEGRIAPSIVTRHKSKQHK